MMETSFLASCVTGYCFRCSNSNNEDVKVSTNKT